MERLLDAASGNDGMVMFLFGTLTVLRQHILELPWRQHVLQKLLVVRILEL